MRFTRKFSLLLCILLCIGLMACTVAPSVTPETTASNGTSFATTVTSATATTTATVPACSVSVRCDTILDNMDKLDSDKAELVPADGLLYENPAADFTEGESALDVLTRELKAAKIHFEYETTPAYGTTYIEGIGNLYELDCGELSGWTYRVNGEFLSYGCSEYIVKPGDVVEFLYTCDMGADVGNVYVGE
ncbi:MAG: DUF4430 domain-containing protein [Clostridiaceae bacterium]|nr:DUF4430 domain-containing protein [Clostridiaceae bacterium]